MKSRMELQEWVPIFFAGFFIGAILVLIILFLNTKDHTNIIRHGCAQYNSKTGNFEWIKVIK